MQKENSLWKRKNHDFPEKVEEGDSSISTC